MSELRHGELPPETDPELLDEQETIAIKAEQLKVEEWATRLNLSMSDVRVFCRNGFTFETIPSANTPHRRMMLAHLKRAEVPSPRWVMVSGLYPEILFSEVDRRKRLRALYKTVTLLIKRALGREAADPMKDERSIYWDPTAEVCRDLEIAPSKLSSLLKEFSGHSLTQVVDCVRAEKIQKVLRKQIRSFVNDFKTQCATSATKNEQEVTPWVVWKALKVSRKWPAFCQNTWALEFGFATYRRMYRACLAVWKQTPHQMEMALIAEFLKSAEPAENNEVVSEEEGLSAIEKQVREITCYAEDS